MEVGIVFVSNYFEIEQSVLPNYNAALQLF